MGYGERQPRARVSQRNPRRRQQETSARACRGSRRMSRAPGCLVFKVIDDESPRALADCSRQRLFRREGNPSHQCLFANVIKAFAHSRRLRAHRCQVVWVEPIVIQLMLTGATRALIAISNVYARVQDAHGVAEKLSPRLFFLIPMVVGPMVASVLQHAFRPLCAV